MYLCLECLSGSVRGANEIIEEFCWESPRGTIPNLWFITLGDVGVLPKDVNGERGGDSSGIGESCGSDSV